MITQPVTFKVDGVDIAGQLYLPEGHKPHASICICHGIPSGKPADPGDGGYPVLAERLCSEGFAALTFNFRGCGESGGNLEMSGWTRDLGAAIDYLSVIPEVDRYRIALLGFSGGAAASIVVAAKDERISSVAACASPAEFDLFNGPNSDAAQVVEYFRSTGVFRDADYPNSTEEWLAGFEKVKPIDYVAGIAPRPLLIVHGLRDETVNITHAHRLYSKAGEPKRLAILEGSGHRLRADEDAMLTVIDWFKAIYIQSPPQAIPESEDTYIDPYELGEL